MKINSFIAALFLGGIMSSCATVNVENAAKINLENYRKFSFAQPEVTGAIKNPLLRNGITDQNIQHAIGDELAKKGILRDDQNPDFLVMYHEYFEQKSHQVPNATNYPYYGYGAWGFGPSRYGFRGHFYPINYGVYYHPWSYGGYHTEHYTDGTLIIDVLDAKTSQLLWRGSIENPVGNPARLSKQFAKEAQAILNKYPTTHS